jgi:hypothetical protein
MAHPRLAWTRKLSIHNVAAPMNESPPLTTRSAGETACLTIDHWREAMEQLRHLSNDVWRGLKLFLEMNALLLIALIGVVVFCEQRFRLAVLLILISALGAALTLTARYIFKRHRIYYLQMLARKSLIEDELGYYQIKLAGSESDLAFPWRVAPEVVVEIKKNPEAWIQKMLRARGTIALWQFVIYEALIGLYGLAFLFGAFRLLR